MASKTAGSRVIGIRNDLTENGVLIEKDGVLVFKKDYIFSSPSASAAVVLARSANGWTE